MWLGSKSLVDTFPEGKSPSHASSRPAAWFAVGCFRLPLHWQFEKHQAWFETVEYEMRKQARKDNYARAALHSVFERERSPNPSDSDCDLASHEHMRYRYEPKGEAGRHARHECIADLTSIQQFQPLPVDQ